MPFLAVSTKNPIVSKEAPAARKKAPTVRAKAQKHNCKQRSSIVSRKRPTVNKKSCMVERNYSPLPPIFGSKAFFRGGGWLFFLRPHAAGILYAPPSIHAPPLEGYFQGWGCTKFSEP